MEPRIDPKVDFAFKHVFGREQNERLLISLLDAVLQPPPGQEIISLELLNPFNEKESLDDKPTVLDIKARDQSGRQFNVEMQMLAYGAFRQRALYYWARLYHMGEAVSQSIERMRRLSGLTTDDCSVLPRYTAFSRAYRLSPDL